MDLTRQDARVPFTQAGVTTRQEFYGPFPTARWPRPGAILRPELPSGDLLSLLSEFVSRWPE